MALRPLRPDSLASNGAERDCDLLHVELALEIDVGAQTIRGRVEHELAALVSGTERVQVHAAGLTVDRVEDGAGTPLAFAHDGDLVTIELGRTLARGERARIALDYHGKPEKGLYFRQGSKYAEGFAPQVWSQGQEEDNRFWIPVWDFPNERATFSARITVGHGLTVLSNGVLQDVTVVDADAPGGAVRTFSWRLDETIPSYLIALAAGRWEHYEDFGGGVPLDYWVAPGTGEERARRAFGETPAILDYFVELLDEPFPYPRYAQVAVDEFLYAGMENASLTILADHVVGDAAEIGDLDGDPRLLLAHEAAHQWFGDLVTCFGWSNLWLNEAWASYLELCFEGHVAGLESKRLWLERYREIYLARGERARLPLAESWRAQASPQRTNHEYDKGPWVIYMIHQALGDEVFWQGVRAYLDRHAHGLVTTADFQRAIFDSTGHNIESWIEQFVEGAGHPVYRVSFDPKKARRGTGALKLDVRQEQEVDELVPLFDLPVTVELVYADGQRTRHGLRVAAERETFELPLEGPVIDLVFDADCALLCEIELEKGRDMWLRQAQDTTNAALRWRALRALAPLAWGIEGQPVRAAFAHVLKEESEPILRWLAASLCTYTDLRSALLCALEEDPEPRVRLAAASSLAGLGLDGPTLARLRGALAGETSPAVRGVLSGILGDPRGAPEGRTGDP